MQLARLMKRHIDIGRNRADRMGMQLKLYSPQNRIRDQKQKSIHLEEQLQAEMARILRRNHHRVDLYIERMKGLSPLEKLKSGFSYVENGSGGNVRSVAQVQTGDDLTIRVWDGKIQAKVTGTCGEETWQET